jgi:predicted nucleotidyltransferase
MTDINQIISAIKDTLKDEGVEKVILFGSYAYGIPTDDSDIDILAIKDIPESETRDFRLRLKKILWAKFGRLNFTFDILVDNEERIKKRISIGDLFYQEIYSKGRILYA